jgi:hypothetical protein
METLYERNLNAARTRREIERALRHGLQPSDRKSGGLARRSLFVGQANSREVWSRAVTHSGLVCSFVAIEYIAAGEV